MDHPVNEIVAKKPGIEVFIVYQSSEILKWKIEEESHHNEG
jgi:hypothetical protein